MKDEECYDCGCCQCDGWCEILNNYINEIDECNVPGDEKWKYSCWNIYKDDEKI